MREETGETPELARTFGSLDQTLASSSTSAGASLVASLVKRSTVLPRVEDGGKLVSLERERFETL
jgi:hypothetical protein